MKKTNIPDQIRAQTQPLRFDIQTIPYYTQLNEPHISEPIIDTMGLLQNA